MRKKTIVLLLLPVLLAAALFPLMLRADDDDPGDDDGGLRHRGLVESRPAGNLGTWGIGGQTFTAVAATLIEEEHGPLSVGACAEVYYVSATDHTATKIESKEPIECNDTGDSYVQIYGILQSFPAGLIGDWVVDGVTYTADGSAEFQQEHGAFAAGQCVEVKYYPGAMTAVEIESENSYKCNGDGTPPSAYTEV
ncbi:MAG: hypothetical protein HF973_08550 [Chloroflexi bacterium]|nr:hypothetical protein [Chloroflexota bacterium]